MEKPKSGKQVLAWLLNVCECFLSMCVSVCVCVFVCVYCKLRRPQKNVWNDVIVIGENKIRTVFLVQYTIDSRKCAYLFFSLLMIDDHLNVRVKFFSFLLVLFLFYPIALVSSVFISSPGNLFRFVSIRSVCIECILREKSKWDAVVCGINKSILRLTYKLNQSSFLSSLKSINWLITLIGRLPCSFWNCVSNRISNLLLDTNFSALNLQKF